MPGPASGSLTIGRYAVLSTLGRGAMGVIYKAHDPVIDRHVAIKLVSADLLDGEERANYIARFQQEAQAAGRCSHPNIVGIYDYALHEGNPYLAMEFIDGITLAQVDRSRGFAIPEIVELTCQVLDALHSAHLLGVVHRDIKPANIMLTTTGWVKVADFGISRIASSSLTGAGSVVGTPAYMSPEQCRGAAVDARSDVFSVGVVLYELVTGRKPFLGSTPHELWHRLLNEAPPDPAGLRPDLPPELGAIIARSLEKHVADRFASAAAMAGALRRIAGSSTASLAGIPADTTATRLDTGSMPAGGLALDSETIGTLERQLAHYVGPIASQLIRRAARTAGDMDALCRTLAGAIADPAAQQRFTQQMLSRRGGMASTTAGAATAITPADLEAIQKELTRYIGPVAKVLVKRAAAAAGSRSVLWQRVAESIEKPADRAAFLRAAPPP